MKGTKGARRAAEIPNRRPRARARPGVTMTDEPPRFSKRAVSDELLVEQRRVRGTRAAVARTLTGRRMRRRVVPPLAIGSMVVIGTAAAGTWVHGIVEPTQTGLVSSTQQAADPSAAIQQATLDQLRQQIAADEVTLAALKAAKLSHAATAPATQAGQPVRAAQAPAAGTGKGVARPAAPAKAAASQPKPTVAAAAAPAKAVPPPPPAVHATTGASGGRG